MRAFLPCLALLLLIAPGALTQTSSPGSRVDITSLAVPERTLAGLPFEVQVTLHNKGATELEVELMGALYRPAEGSATPCGSATSPRFVTFTHMFQPHFRIGAGETLTYPPEGAAAWRHRYDASQVPPSDAAYELCVFAIEGQHQQRIEYLDFEAVSLVVRGQNAAPTAGFTFSPENFGATERVTFRASGDDADGDPLTFSWDFGHVNASGRAVARGAEATHLFYPEGTYTVTLTVSDGFAQTRVTREVVVGPEPPTAAPVSPIPADERAGLPFPAWLVLTAALLALAARRARR